MIQIDKSLDDSVNIINRLKDDELDYLNSRNGKPIWIVGDCLIIATKFTGLITELELVEHPYSTGINPDAHKSWQKLIDKLNRNHIPVRLGKDSDREVEKTLANISPYDSDELLKWEDQRAHYSALTLEEIGEEFLGPIQTVMKVEAPSEKITDRIISLDPNTQKNIDDVVKFSKEGLTVKLIASRIGISVSTVNRYRKHEGIRKKQ